MKMNYNNDLNMIILEAKKHSKKFQLMDKKMRMRLRKQFEDENYLI